jgi:hypothetical protein
MLLLTPTPRRTPCGHPDRWGSAATRTRLTDYSPEGHAAVAAVLRTTLADLEAAVPVDSAERLCKGYLEDLCSAQLALIESVSRTDSLAHSPDPRR